MDFSYIAITIGPIYKTFRNVRKTRELWGASYVFSYISKRIIEKIIDINENAILLPHYEVKSAVGIGLYPDRIFIKKIGTLNIETIITIKDNIIDEEIAKWTNTDCSAFLRQYFRIYVIEYTIPENKNPVEVGNRLLDTAELRNIWELNENKNELLSFFRNINKIKTDEKKWIHKHFLLKDIFGEVRFESLPEISTRAIRENNKPAYKRLVHEYCYDDSDKLKDDEGFIKELKNTLNLKGKEEIFKNYHKYIAIVKADGDKVGAYIKAIDDDYENALTELSKSLYNWGIESARLIEKYSGIPIYVGGDDVLFLAPIVGYDKQNILGLTEQLNESFRAYFEHLPIRKDENGDDIKPTLSFGVSITYFKYPLYEALNKADELLRWAKKTRNATSISLLKHSGSSFDISLSNDVSNEITQSFKSLNDFFIDDDLFVTSIIHHFRDNENIYRLIGADRDKVSNYLLNNFDNKKYEKYVVHIACICSSIYTENHRQIKKPNKKELKKISEKSIREIHSLLRILKFLNGQDDGK